MRVYKIQLKAILIALKVCFSKYFTIIFSQNFLFITKYKIYVLCTDNEKPPNIKRRFICYHFDDFEICRK